MKQKTRIITHTGGDLPLSEAQQLGVTVIPDIVIFGETEYRNMTQLTAEVFYEKMKASAKLPTSSHPSTGEFVKAFLDGDDSQEVFCLIVTSKLSGTYNAALAGQKMAQRRHPDRKIVVYDTQQCSHGMANLIRAAVKYANEGLGAEQIAEKLELLRPKMGVYFMLDTLENARKGGRVGMLKAVAADAMNLKPLLMFDNGEVKDFDVAFGKKNGLEKLCSLFKKEADLNELVTVFHAMAAEQAEKFAGRLEELGAKVIIEPVGPVIGIYTGIGCVGVAYTKK